MTIDIADRIKVVERKLEAIYQRSVFDSHTQLQIKDCLRELESIRIAYADEWEQLELYRRGLKQ